MTTDTLTLTGRAAITYAETHGMMLRKHADPTEGARDGLTADEAREVARIDPSLVWVEVLRRHAHAVPAWLDAAVASESRTAPLSAREVAEADQELCAAGGDAELLTAAGGEHVVAAYTEARW